MRYELAHDSLARQILDRVSGEAKARRQAELLISRAYERYQERQVLLSSEDLDEIRPHEKTINCSGEERAFIRKSKDALARAARRKRQFLIGVISLLSAFLVFALWQWQRSVAGTKALRAKAAYEQGYPSTAFQLARSAYRTLGVDQATIGTIREVLDDIYTSGLELDLQHDQDVTSFDLHPSEEELLSITDGPEAVVWDIPSGEMAYRIAHPSDVLNGAFIPWENQSHTLTVGQDSTVYFWDQSGSPVRNVSFAAPVQGFLFNTKLQLILLWTENELSLLSDSTNIWTLPLPPDIRQVDFSPNENYLMIANRDSISSWWIEFIKRGLPPQRRAIVKGEIKWAGFIASDASNPMILAQFANGANGVFDYKGTLDTVPHYGFLNDEFDLIEANGEIIRFDFSYPGFDHPKTLFQTDSTTVYYWSAYRISANGAPAGNLDFYTRYDQPITTTAFSKEDRYLLTASVDGRVDIWDIQTASIKRFKRFRAQIRQAEFMAQDRRLITRGSDNLIKIWSLNTVPKLEAEAILDHYDHRLKSVKE